MKNIIILLFITTCALSFSACKKCYTCRPKCYQCTYLSTYRDVCRNEFDNVDDFNTTIATYISSGYVCNENDSVLSAEEICGNSTSVAAANANLKANDGYRCDLNK